MYTYDEEKKRNIHTQYRTRLFGFRMIMIRKKQFVITKHFVIDLFKKKQQENKTRYKKTNKEKR